MSYKRWDVVAVSFPFLEGTDVKRRAALIVSTHRLENEQTAWAQARASAEPETRVVASKKKIDQRNCKRTRI